MALPEFSTFHPSALIERARASVEHVTFSVQASEAARAAFTRPGQFVKMRVADAEGRAHEGIFALSSAPAEGTLSFLVRVDNPAGGEAADRIAQMPLGSPIEVTLPTGDGYALERAGGRDLAFVAVGTALAPVRSALEVVLRERDRYGAISLDYGLRSMAHLPFVDDVARWRDRGVDVALHLSGPAADGTIVGVRAQDALFDRLGPRLARTVIVVAGHDALVREVRARRAQAGGDPADVLHNY